MAFTDELHLAMMDLMNQFLDENPDLLD